MQSALHAMRHKGFRTHGKLSGIERSAHPVRTRGLVGPEEYRVALRDRDGDTGDLDGLDGRAIALYHGERVAIDGERERDEGARVDDAKSVRLVAVPQRKTERLPARRGGRDLRLKCEVKERRVVRAVLADAVDRATIRDGLVSGVAVDTSRLPTY